MFGRPFVKRLAICYRTVVLSCLSVTLVYACIVAKRTDQDETWHAGKPRPIATLRWIGTQLSLPQRGIAPGAYSPKFLAHICCGQMAALASAQATLC